MSLSFEPGLVRAWLAGRSVARGMPTPVVDRGGWRVDTGLPEEVARWVFAEPGEGLQELGRSVTLPFHLLKLCAPAEVLMRHLPPRWQLQSESWFMAAAEPMPEAALASGYRLEHHTDRAVTQVRILTESGDLAASGYAAQTSDAFVYDRIATAADHRRRGLGRVLMAALCRARTRPVPQLLTATADGHALYTTLGWSVVSPYVTAGIPPNP